MLGRVPLGINVNTTGSRVSNARPKEFNITEITDPIGHRDDPGVVCGSLDF